MQAQIKVQKPGVSSGGFIFQVWALHDGTNQSWVSFNYTHLHQDNLVCYSE